MSEFHVEAVRIGKIGKHPNADTLSLTHVRNYCVIFKTGEFQEGDMAVYIPVDAIVPDKPQYAFLKGRRRIRACRLRGIFSMGMVVPMPAGLSVPPGTDMQEVMEITKYVPPEELDLDGDNVPDLGIMPVYTDIESLRRYPQVLKDGQQVVLTEKIHGCNARFTVHEGQLICGSHKRIKRDSHNSLWWRAARQYDLGPKLALMPQLVFYGEIYGQVQDLKYGVPSGIRLAFFDVYDKEQHKYLDYDQMLSVCQWLGLPVVPFLARGPWDISLWRMAEGATAVSGGDCIREGFVVRPVHEAYDDEIGRVILKMVGEGYLLRKQKD